MDSSIVSPCEFHAGWPAGGPQESVRDLPWLTFGTSTFHTAVALAGVLSGALIVLFGAALIHLLLLRRKAKQQARASSRRLIALDGHGATTTSQSDSDLGSLEAAEGGAEEEKGGSRLSLNLTPNQPIFVDVEAVYGSGGAGARGGGGGGAQAGLQLILTPPTPRRVNREIP
ncbi:hypothetical protein EDB92DRAFT_1828710 [Lactarius akahatsu]|uniref:Uncharacterized protein n=1 Tax=Lactarius akahatsu TaxID=416441 RepID=A0AAD4QIF9_9AGAM|nr:hypothetical protein EDB92DRAFT_1828710 [Lactarius akahatsu]